jgi:predicted transcriptional regulator YheO
MGFRTLKSLKELTHDEQAYIYFLCLNYDKQVQPIRDFIDRLVSEVCEGDENKENALFELLKQGYHANTEYIAKNNYLRKNTLYELRGQFFLEFANREHEAYR